MNLRSLQRVGTITAGTLLLLSLVGSWQLVTLSAAQARPNASVRPQAQATTSQSEALDRKLVTANTTFGFKLFAQALKADAGKNVFISPSSVAIALAMTYNGAEGETQQAMAKALELQGLSLADVNRSNAALISGLQKADPAVEVAIANSLWTQKGTGFQREFLQRNQQFYKAQITELDFTQPQAASQINRWVQQKTRGKISQIVDQVQPNLVLLLLNAVYFKGKWSEAFDAAATVERPFTLANGTRKQHPLMTQTGEYDYYETNKFQAVSLPYGEGRLSLYLFLPKSKSNLPSFYRDLTAANWEQWMKEFRNRPGSVQIPKFKLEYDLNLNNALKTLGMGIAFNGSKADFSGMSQADLAIDQVRHKTFVEVNEVGTEATAATSVEMIVTSTQFPPTPFKLVADRPFFYAIRDNQTGSLLFMGSMVNPQT
ncbi:MULTISPECIES: serpin family protein [Trichocoleus]|uniref:Serpin family protein n=1 Tax=Trichocoleus desertorum GB2-A4 TaxID=2933944 RepID=A0ABV0JCW7_9CYAN|nr:serpin family protein [Trichocoleus sp. FACHB-46]MBD1860904.1 serpin family protein [Trichocoleus sp. FACHB-46]